MKKKKKNEEVQNIETDEEDSASEEIGSDSPVGGGGDKVKQGGEEREMKSKGKVTPPKDSPIEAKTSKKRKVSLRKHSTRKKTCANRPQSKNMCSQKTMSV
jgi:hypothetical protein